MNTPSPTDKLGRVLANAIRLYSDSVLLFKNQRYASCVALAILSLEEFGKFISFLRGEGVDVQSRTKHANKQLAVATFFLNASYQAAVSAYAAEHGYALIPENKVSKEQEAFLKTNEAKEINDQFKRFAELDFADDNMELFDRFLQHMVKEESLIEFARVHAGETNRLKNQALYLDVDEHGDVVSDPETVSEETAKRYIDICKRVMAYLRKSLG